ncbi:MAG TPA: nucleotidyltransferase domain-containing protein [Verrucomicrobiota bacterium]|nr:nucleotidyltransferase domain-containing protein [Verrucomicrobiota bacterium]HRT07015.1 nucleotidyltransferase domain-containing protein [Candidatus Paceibacterota bacterium]HRT57968.1 nucleotidyltransferase domain-containing protein [Candidatus Paceibacterota bacterium]
MMSGRFSNLGEVLPMPHVAEFCRRWRITRLEIFGSALRDDFDSNSDVDLVATYAPDVHWSLLDRSRMRLELESLLGRSVDLLNRRALEKAVHQQRAAEILAQAQPVYAEP